jgi:hypothetical protein
MIYDFVYLLVCLFHKNKNSKCKALKLICGYVEEI